MEPGIEGFGKDIPEDDLVTWVGEPTEPWKAGRRIKSFEDLEVWLFCRELRKELSRLARRLPRDERFRLTDQIIRASRSVTNNIAEGYGRFTFKDNIHFCRQARGSLYELIDHLLICLDEQYISQEAFEDHKKQCQSAIRLLNGYIRFLSTQATDQ